jgi:choline kinase
MRELHDGIDLLDEERTGGAFVFQNWDKWVDRCEQVISYLDQQVRENHRKSASDTWRKRGFVCGVPWSTFRRAVENYRKWLIDFMGGLQEISKQLVFAHNDVSRLSLTSTANMEWYPDCVDPIWQPPEA